MRCGLWAWRKYRSSSIFSGASRGANPSPLITRGRRPRWTGKRPPRRRTATLQSRWKSSAGLTSTACPATPLILRRRTNLRPQPPSLMEIPYAVKPRPDTGLYNAKVGIWLFLASEVMLFGALFCSYILLRVNAPEGMWPHHCLNIWLGMTNTIVLILSSVTVVLGWASLKMGKFQRYKFYQGITLLCALVFLGIKSYEYHDKFMHYEVILNHGGIVDGHLQKALST